jgi:hypothetical protein
MAMLRIEEKITLVRYVPVVQLYYPSGVEGQGAMTPQEAREYELSRDRVDQLENFDESLQYADFEQPLGTKDAGVTGDYSIQVEIVE